MTYTTVVYEQYLADIQKGLNRMARKADKYGIDFSYDISPVTEKVKVTVYGSNDGRTLTEVSSFWTDGVRVAVDYEPIKANGWSVIAKIEALPGSDKRLVDMVSHEEPKAEWYHSDMHCDHCNTNRARNCVFICRHKDGREVQVGKSCLMEYTGINPLSVLTGTEIQNILPVDEPDAVGLDDFHPSKRYWETETIIALADDIIHQYGYAKSDSPDSTKSRLADALLVHKEPSDKGMAKAELIRDWILAKGESCYSSLESNIQALVESGYANQYQLGYLAYAPMAYEKAMEWEAKKRMEAENSSTSQHVGEIGKRIEIVPVSAKVITSWETQWGETYLWKISDRAGNVYTWKTSGSVVCHHQYDEMNGKHVYDVLPKTIKGTVKAHTEYRGVLQTELTRCKCLF